MVLLVCFFVLNSELAHAATYNVGDTRGWTFNTLGWPKGKRFRAGDTLGMYLPISRKLLNFTLTFQILIILFVKLYLYFSQI